MKLIIKVNNKAEFDALMEHYERKGWEWRGGQNPKEYTPFSFPRYITHHNHMIHSSDIEDGYTPVDFPVLAAIVGIEIKTVIVDGLTFTENGDMVTHDKGWLSKDGIVTLYRTFCQPEVKELEFDVEGLAKVNRFLQF